MNDAMSMSMSMSGAECRQIDVSSIFQFALSFPLRPVLRNSVGMG